MRTHWRLVGSSWAGPHLLAVGLQELRHADVRHVDGCTTVTFGVATPDSAIQFFRSAAPVPWTEGPSELITHGLGLQQQIRASE